MGRKGGRRERVGRWGGRGVKYMVYLHSPSGRLITALSLVWAPCPHVSVQTPHRVHSVSEQPQSLSPTQLRVSAPFSHARPPNNWGLIMTRCRLCVQLSMQSPHSFHPPITQSMSLARSSSRQSCVSHCAVCIVIPHSRPPSAAPVRIPPVRFLVPPPHRCEQGSHASH